MIYKIINWIIRIFAYGAVLCVVYFLVSTNFMFNGTFNAEYSFEKKSPFIRKLVPEGRVLPVIQNEEGQYIQEMVIDPVYFEIYLPNSVDEITIGIEYTNTSQSVIELGMQTTEEGWGYSLQPLENNKLDTLEWEYIKDNEVYLFQKEKYFNTLEEFFATPPKAYQVITYHYDMKGIDSMNVNTKLDSYKYVLTTYDPSVKENVRYVTQTFKYADALVKKGTIRFVISAPLLDANGEVLTIRRITLEGVKE